jgi:hypothetical protein
MRVMTTMRMTRGTSESLLHRQNRLIEAVDPRGEVALAHVLVERINERSHGVKPIVVSILGEGRHLLSGENNRRGYLKETFL